MKKIENINFNQFIRFKILIGSFKYYFYYRFGGTEAAIFCCLTTIGKQLQHENLVDITLYAKLYHNQRPGIWKDIVSLILINHLS